MKRNCKKNEVGSGTTEYRIDKMKKGINAKRNEQLENCDMRMRNDSKEMVHTCRDPFEYQYRSS